MNAKKKKTASSTSRIRWTKEVQEKMDGGTITSYDMKISNYKIHIWQMYGPGNKWNWFLSNTDYGETGTYGDRMLLQSSHSGEETARDAKDRAMRAFIWYFAMRLARDTQVPDKVLKGFEDGH